MKTVGIVCEYNPFHRGHEKQLRMIRARCGDGVCIVCLMSGRFVQRGDVAVFDPMLRARAAVECGANVVLELPVPTALNSAEGFAAGAVEVLERLGGIDALCFGCESARLELLTRTAQILCSPEFDAVVRECLRTGVSYAGARALAAGQLGADVSVLERPNDILAVEYCKALLRQNSVIQPMPVQRAGEYHAREPEADNPSAASLRRAMECGAPWLSFVPEAARPVLAGAQRHSLQYGQRAVLARLRAMEEPEFSALPFGAEGLWRKVMHACRTQPNLEAIVGAAKSKRYARTRITRMLMCAYLGLTAQLQAQPAPYVRLLALDARGGQYLRGVRETARISLLNAGAPAPAGAYRDLERRGADLYALCAQEDEIFLCEMQKKDRVYCKK